MSYVVLAAHVALVCLVRVLQAVPIQIGESVTYAVKAAFGFAPASAFRIPVLTW